MQNDTNKGAVTEMQFRLGVIPRAQLSMMASQLAVERATNKNAKEFAGFELMEAIAVIDVLKDVGTPVPALTDEHQAFLNSLKEAQGANFDKIYMQAEQSNHEFLRDLAEEFLATSPVAGDSETRHLAMVALYAFTEHVAMSKRINSELAA